jgi:hypothetical protein
MAIILNIQMIKNKVNKILFLNQKIYIQKLIEKYKLQDIKPITLSIADR